MKSLLRLWRRYSGNDFDIAFARMLPLLVRLLDTAQYETASEAVENAPTVMRDLGGFAWEPEYTPDPWQWVGVNGNGYNTIEVMYEPIIEAKTAIKHGMRVEHALMRIETGMLTRARTCLTDTQHSASMVTAKGRYADARPVRVLNPPSCGRCVILAGTSNVGERHPNCDCTMAWSHDLPENAYASPSSWLNELVENNDMDALARVLGSRANARAWLDGADLNQLVNAYRRKGSVTRAQFYSRKIKYTTEGTTRRGAAAYRLISAGYANGFIKHGGRYEKIDRPRLMPETIYEICDRQGRDPKQMLRNYGWIL